MRLQALLLLLGTSASAAQATQSTRVASTDSLRSAFLHLIDRARTPLAAASVPLPMVDGLAHEHITFAAESSQRVPMLLVRNPAAAGRRPVVIFLHGTNGNKENLSARLRTYAARGFIAVAIDGRYHGERTGTVPGPSTSYVNAILRTYTTGQDHPFLYDAVWDVMRLVDYLFTRPDVDSSRIGLTGSSKGGMETYLAAAVDPRIAVAVPMLGVQSFRWALDHSSWDSRAWTIRAAVDSAARAGREQVSAAFMRKFYDRVAPGIYSTFDGPSMLPLVSPRPLLVINGDSDPRTPAGGLRECVAAAERAFAEAGVRERFEFLLQPNTGHEVTPAANDKALEWFARWLSPNR